MTILSLANAVDNFEASFARFSPNAPAPTHDDLTIVLDHAYKQFTGKCKRESESGTQADAVLIMSMVRHLITQ